MTSIKISFLLTLLSISSVTQHKMVKTKVTDGITVSLPKSMFKMTPDDIAQRYPSVRQPLGSYTNEERQADFSVNVSASQWRPSDVEMAHEFFKATITNLYDRVDFIKEEVKTIGDRQFMCFEFESRINGEKLNLGQHDSIRKYTYIQYLIVKGKTLVFSFNCPQRLKSQWATTANEMMNSIQVKKNI